MAAVLDSVELDIIQDSMSRIYARMQLRTSCEKPRARIERTQLGLVGVSKSAFGFEMDYAIDPMGALVVGSVHTGTYPRHNAGRWEDSFGAGDVVLLAQPDEPCAGRLHNADNTLVDIDPLLLTQVAATAPGRRSEPVRLTGHRPVSAAAGRHLQRTLAYLSDTTRVDPSLSQQPLVVSTTCQLLAASVLAAFPNTALTEPTTTDRRDAHPASVRRAVAFIESHADTPLTLAEIAAAAHVTTRALQYAFRRHLATTPMAYLRQVRLDQAHAALRAADPATGATVTAIAARWGFLQPSRFATLYRAAYGVCPSHTLRQNL